MDARDRRLILLFFDFSAMEADQIDRAVDAAKKYVNTKMQPADMIAIVSLSTNMRLDLDFTDDKSKNSFGSECLQFQIPGKVSTTEPTGSSEGAAETSGAFTADDTDFNTFSADRKLLALQSLMQAVGKLSQKKSLIYFSNGISQSGVDNQSALRAATAAAVKANVAIYPLDVRGLQALPAGGEAQNASLHGQSAYYWCFGAERSEQQRRVAGNAFDAGGGHRRQGVLRFERFQRRVFASAERYFGVLHSRLHQLESLPRTAGSATSRWF